MEDLLVPVQRPVLDRSAGGGTTSRARAAAGLTDAFATAQGGKRRVRQAAIEVIGDGGRLADVVAPGRGVGG
jgi:hypothetical protein